MTDCGFDARLKCVNPDLPILGGESLLSAPAFVYNPTKHKLAATITLCSDTDQQGMCATNKIDFEP